MISSRHSPNAGVASTSASRFSSSALAAVFRAESRLITELTAILLHQRQGVANDDVQAVDDSIFAVHRVVHTMNEARRRRRVLLAGLAGTEEIGLRDLEAALGPEMTDEIREARSELQAAADALAREVSLNRRVIQEALRRGEEYMRALCGAQPGPTRPVRYAADASGIDESQRSGFLLNRQV